MEPLGELAQVLPVQGLPETAAVSYGTIRAELERKGEMIGNNDLWIAAHAKAAGLVSAELDDLDGYCILVLKKWTLEFLRMPDRRVTIDGDLPEVTAESGDAAAGHRKTGEDVSGGVGILPTMA